MGTPVEIEFAVNLDVPAGRPAEFGLLQMRPMVLNRELEVLDLDRYGHDQIVCQSGQVLGNGVQRDLRDLVVVDRDRFERSRSQEVASDLGRLNARLRAENRKYILIGVGRWDPWTRGSASR